jgi:hypothetical protein
VIPEVAPDHVEITGVDDAENAEPMKFQADLTSPVEIPGLMSPVEIPGVDTAQQTIEINDLNLSPPQEPALIEPAKPDQPRQSGRERKAAQKYAPSMSGKSYAYTQLGLLFLQDTRYKYSSEVVEMVMTQLSLKAALKQWGEDAKAAVEAEAKQLHWRNSFRPVCWKDVDEERRKQNPRVACVRKEEAHRSNQDAQSCRGQQAERLHQQRECKLSHSSHGVSATYFFG